MINWSEGCACHRSDLMYQPVAGAAEEVYEDVTPDPLRGSTCPFRGRRLPEMASGSISQIFAEAQGVVSGELFIELNARPTGVSNALPQARIVAIINDIIKGCQHLRFMLELKFAFYSEIACRCCAIFYMTFISL